MLKRLLIITASCGFTALAGTGAVACTPLSGLVKSRQLSSAYPIAPIDLNSASVRESALRNYLGVDEQIWDSAEAPGDRQALLRSIDHSLNYLKTGKAREDYRRYSLPGVTHDRVRRSLERFRQLLLTACSASDLQTVVEQEFVFYQAIGKDGQGTVAFTGYFEPVHVASRTPTAEFRYPLFRPPSNFATWSKPHPTRLQLEGADGLMFTKSQLRGSELVWLRDRLEAFLVQVQGSARLQLTDGSTIAIGYAGNTDYSYTGIGRELVKDGKFRLEDLTLQLLVKYFEQHPADLNTYLPRNQRFVFFQERGNAPAVGSLGVPVTAERSIATDKTKFPPGALAFLRTELSTFTKTDTKTDRIEKRQVSRYVLDQDTGGAIVGPGRVDIFMGTGQKAGEKAGLVNSTGQLYYLLLKP